ncbi:MAG: molybdopterin molybdenumtransferase MoeA [Sulfurimonas sp.]|nr:MAG: molybdopterin molybdenumtransferase MoeA [Sulfurimonas sp.]
MHKYLNFQEAVNASLKYAKSAYSREIISLDKALGRVLSKDLFCIKNLPSFNNSAMDGFAIKAKDAGKTLKVKITIFAGDSADVVLNESQCCKIMTGAKVPDDADTIIPIEDVDSYENDLVKIKKNVKKGVSLRLKAEEMAIGDLLFKKGEEITSSMTALLASQGIIMIEVYKKLTIAVVSTGNELKEPWQNANEEEIYNCNSYALISLLNEKGFDSCYTGLVPDNLEKSIDFVRDLKNYDVIITSGGISMGDADFVGEAFKQNGLETIFHGVNIKPGRPIMMGKMDKTFVICLPGNPLTAMVNMHLFAILVLRKIQGHNSYFHDIEKAKNIKNFRCKEGRVNIVLGTCNKGEFEVTRENKYGSGMISILNESNAMLVTNEGRSCIEAGEIVNLIRFNCSYLNEQTNIFN